MGKGYNTLIQGDCLNIPQDNSVPLFKTINCHLVWSSPQCSNQRNSGIFGCKAGSLVPTIPYTEQIPLNYIPPSDAVVFGKVYGQNLNPTTLKTIGGEDIFFNYNDLTPWLPRKYCPVPYNIYDKSGPSFTNCHCFGGLIRKMADVNSYQNRLDFDFVDSNMKVPYPRWEKYGCGQKCETYNWLSYTHPASSLYTSIPEPFKITTHFEQSGSPVPSDATKGGNLYLPFCSPMNVRDTNGVVIGRYTGLSFGIIFGQANINMPVRPYLPYDEWTVEPDPTKYPEVDPHKVFYSCDVWVFMRGVTEPDKLPLGSPLLGKIRYYLYSKAPGAPGQIADWRFPFRILFQQGVYGDLPMDVSLNLVGGGTQGIKLNFTNQKILVTY